MIYRVAAGMTLACLALSQVAAQSHQPYADIHARRIKALSDQQIDDLRNGRGMGGALAAELNGYPGPLHVLEHADALALSSEQRSKVQALFAAMKNETQPLGLRIVTKEEELDASFASHRITPSDLQGLTASIGELQGQLRGAHLKYHLLTLDALTGEQLTRYAVLRGYSSVPSGHQGQHHSR